MKIQPALRLQKLPPYPFAELDTKKNQLLQEGKKFIDLGVGDPDLPTHPTIVQTLIQEAPNPKNHRYPSYQGMLEFRKAAAEWIEKRFLVSVDPQEEILTLIGSKEGLNHFTQAFVNPGDYVLVPDPGYPVYAHATILAGGTPLFYPLTWENRFQPQWKELNERAWKSVRLVFINYPHNPTSATVTLETYVELVERAKHYGFIICSDAAYCEQGYESLPPSILQVPGAKEVAVEFFSLSKSHNMTGWRIGFAAGNKDCIKVLSQYKVTVDSGVFQAIQYAGITALKEKDKKSFEIYLKRRHFMIEELRRKNYEVFDGGATFYLWVKNPTGKNSVQLAHHFLENGIVVTPGSAFGPHGEGYFRIALTVSEELLKAALARIPK